MVQQINDNNNSNKIIYRDEWRDQRSLSIELLYYSCNFYVYLKCFKVKGWEENPDP